MSVFKAFISSFALALVAASVPVTALAQTPAPAAQPPAPAAPAGSAKLVLLPYESPGSTDPHATAITQTLVADLATAGIAVTTLAPVDHLDAVANAAKICADNNATGILVPEGRYEQTKKVIPAPFVTILRYPTHVEFRLDEVGCTGGVRWTTTTTGDEAPAGAFSVGNLGAAVDAAFRTAIQAAATSRAGATIMSSPVAAAALPAAAPAAAVTPSSYFLVPFEQPGISDPRGADITRSLLTQLQQRRLDVKTGNPIDHFTAVANAGRICSDTGTQAIIIPDVRVEQSSVTGRSHASMRLTLLSCAGTVIGHGAAEADMGQAFMGNFGATVVGVSERAMPPAIDQLFPNAPKPQT
ncbi:MAG TPA: hypothetical protein VGC96_09025 [Candidatus Elarobacter sp.]|jgi:hypothetical protein